MSQWNGRGNPVMSTPKPPEESPDNPMHLVGLRLWLLCAFIIVAAGLANFIFNLIIGSQEQ